jgi:ABC-type Mn2+/Zn2+ transport system ATPase subunit
MLSVRNLTYGPPGLPPIHRGLSFSLGRGELLHVVGPNGSGKSLLLRALLGLAKAHGGEVSHAYRDLRYLPQLQNRAAHLPYSLKDVLHLDGLSASTRDRIGLLEESRLPLSWNRASGGERQRTLLTRFFLQTGQLLVLDEPFNHLDARARERVRSLIRAAIEEDPARGALLVSHDDQPASWMGDVPVRTLALGEEERR